MIYHEHIQSYMPWHINNLTGIPTVDRCSQTKTTYKDAFKYENIIIYKKKNNKTKKKAKNMFNPT